MTLLGIVLGAVLTGCNQGDRHPKAGRHERSSSRSGSAEHQ